MSIALVSTIITIVETTTFPAISLAQSSAQIAPADTIHRSAEYKAVDRQLAAGLRAYVLEDNATAINHWKSTLKAYRRLDEPEGVIVSLLGLRQLKASDEDYGKLFKLELQQFQKQQRNNNLSISNPPNQLETLPNLRKQLYQSVGLALVYPMLDNATKPFLEVYTDLAEAIASGQSLRQIDTLTAVAQAHMDFGDAAKAVQFYEQAQNIDPKILLPKTRKNIEAQLSQGYFIMGENARAIEFHQRRLASLADQPINSAETADPYFSLARSYATIGEYSKTLGQYQSLYQRVYRTCPDTSFRVSTAQSDCQDAIERTLFKNNAQAQATAGNYISAFRNNEKAKAIQERMQNRMIVGILIEGLQALAYNAKNSNNEDNSSSNSTKPESIFAGMQPRIEIQIGFLRDIFSSNLTIARSEKYVSGQVSVLIGLGRIHASIGEYAQALERYQEGLILARKSQNQYQEWASLVGMSRAYESLGDLSKAQAHYQQSLGLAKTIKQEDSKHAEIQMQSAYQALGEYGQAVKFYQRSFDLAQTDRDESRLVQALVGLGDSYQAMNQPIRAAGYYQQATQLATTPENQLSVALALGKSEYERGNYESAKTAAIKIRNLARTTNNIWADRSASVLLGEVAFLQGDPGSAAQHYQSALEISRSNNLREKYKNKNNINAEFLDLINLGKAQLQAGSQTAALSNYQEALEIANKLSPSNQVTARQNLGSFYLSQRNYEAALESYQKALPLTYKPQDLKAESVVLTKLGTLQYQLGNLQEAEKTLFDALKIQETLQRKTDDRNKISVSETQQVAYDVLQQVLVAQGKQDTALAVAERSRARTFSEQLNQRIGKNNQPKSQIIDLSAPPPKEIEFKPLSLDQMRDLASSRKSTMIVYSIVEKTDLANRQSITKPNLKGESSLYIWVVKPDRSVHFRSVNAQTIQAQWSKLQLDQQQECDTNGNPFNNIVSCLFKNMKSQNEISNRDSTSVPASNPASASNPKANKNDFGNSNLSKSNALNQLYNLLIQPIADLLPTEPTDHVTIVPQGSLFLVPFQALQNNQGQYLIQAHTISMAASLSSLNLSTQIAQQNAKPNGSSAVRIANLDLIVGNPTMPTIQNGTLSQQLAALPGAQIEAEAIATLLKTKPLIGSQATKSAVLEKLKTARRIHLATHGFFDEIRGVGSAIALAPDTSSLNQVSTNSSAPEQQLFATATRSGQPNNLFNQEVNGLLTAQEISNQSIHADLVVLSACNTGQGRITGDGVMGLSRSFLTAGATSVVVSLWAVPDSPTAQLMERFYLNLQTTSDKAQALRQAMLGTMQNKPNPRDWGAFSLIGETRSF